MITSKAILIGKKREVSTLKHYAAVHGAETAGFFIKKSACNDFKEAMAFLKDHPDINALIISPATLPVDRNFSKLFYEILGKCGIKIIVAACGTTMKSGRPEGMPVTLLYSLVINLIRFVFTDGLDIGLAE